MQDANSRLLLTRLNAPNFETNTGESSINFLLASVFDERLKMYRSRV